MRKALREQERSLDVHACEVELDEGEVVLLGDEPGDLAAGHGAPLDEDLAEALVAGDALLREGQSGFPTVSFSRRTVTSTQLDWGCVQLSVASSVAVGVELAGLTSCNDNGMCPGGQTCRPLERFCE